MSNKDIVSVLWDRYKYTKHPLYELKRMGVDLERLALDIGMNKKSLNANIQSYTRSLNISTSTCIKLATFFNQDKNVWLNKKIMYEFYMWFRTYRKVYSKIPHCNFQTQKWGDKTSVEFEKQIKEDGPLNTFRQFQKDEGFVGYDIDAAIHPLGLNWSLIVNSKRDRYSADESIRLGLYIGFDTELLFRENIHIQVEEIQKGESNEENSSL